jgi:hypothetical protein
MKRDQHFQGLRLHSLGDAERRCGNPKSGDQWANSLRADERRSAREQK